MENQNPGSEDQDIFQELYGEDDGTWAKPIAKPKTGKQKTAVGYSAPVGKKSAGHGAGRLAVVLLIVVAVVCAAFFLLKASCVFGHDWQDATCTAPKFCRACDTVEGAPLGHLPGKASCTEPVTCLNCDALLQTPSGHTWRAAYGDCEYCFATFPESMNVPADALKVNTGEQTHFFAVFALSANKWAVNHYVRRAELFSFTEKPTWEDAVGVCESFGGALAEIPSAEIGDAVHSGLIQDWYGDNILYFGLTDQTEEGQWSWLSGADFSYSNWYSGQPDGGKYKNHAGFYGKYADGSWRDGNFREDIRYIICEWVLPNY